MATSLHERAVAPDIEDRGSTVSPSPYPRSKRALDVALAAPALLVAAPILAAIRLAMLASGDRGPFLYRAVRVGEGGLPVTVFKIRTMRPREDGPMVTTRDDGRITPLGRSLRRHKLDELPQLWNVLVGDMGLVGPRPEDPSYVDFADPVHRQVFTQRPGITGLAQLQFRNEAELLEGANADRMYREEILPAKLRLDREYLEQRSLRLDLAIIARTVAAVFGRGASGHGSA
ncbi:MAG TPA: sugar transferase [Candidatus Limnocylindrales bacterium]|nr:sugar transferase [Candidatus Limnocylindrales bacterium]